MTDLEEGPDGDKSTSADERGESDQTGSTVADEQGGPDETRSTTADHEVEPEVTPGNSPDPPTADTATADTTDDTEPSVPAVPQSVDDGTVLRRRAAIVTGALLGLVVAVVHWSGLVLAGALVGVAASSLRNAIVTSLAVGAFAWLAFVGWLWYLGSATQFLGMWEFAAVSLTIALGLPVLGSLVRGLV